MDAKHRKPSAQGQSMAQGYRLSHAGTAKWHSSLGDCAVGCLTNEYECNELNTGLGE